METRWPLGESEGNVKEYVKIIIIFSQLTTLSIFTRIEKFVTAVLGILLYGSYLYSKEQHRL